MQTIYSYALEAAMKAGMFNENNSLSSLIDDMDENQRNRFVEAVIGIVDPNKMRETMPQKSMADKKVVCTYRSFNYLENRVNFSYQRTDEKWFKTPEEAQKYSESGKYSWSTYNGSKTDDYKFQAFWTYDDTSWTYYQTWIDNAIKEEA